MTYDVIVSDISNERELIQWAINNCESFAYVLRKNIRIGDDRVATYFFNVTDEKDTMWFRLNWS